MGSFIWKIRKDNKMSMLGITIDITDKAELGWDNIGGEYYVKDRINNQVYWSKTLGEARKDFERITK